MALSPQKFREIIIQLLYSQEIGHPDEVAMTNLIMSELAITKKTVKLAQEKVQDIIKLFSEIDSLISSVSTSYNFDRIQTVTKSILRLGVYELFFEKSVPHKIVIAEAIRLSRKFSSPESGSFANALLDNLYQMSLGTQVDKSELEKEALELIENEKDVEQAHLEHLLKEDDLEDDS